VKGCSTSMHYTVITQRQSEPPACTHVIAASSVVHLYQLLVVVAVLACHFFCHIVSHCRHCFLTWPKHNYIAAKRARNAGEVPDSNEVSRFLQPVLAAVAQRQLPGVQKLRRRFIKQKQSGRQHNRGQWG
jgi:hypothetical protein